MTCKILYKYGEKLRKEVKFEPTTFFSFFFHSAWCKMRDRGSHLQESIVLYEWMGKCPNVFRKIKRSQEHPKIHLTLRVF